MINAINQPPSGSALSVPAPTLGQMPYSIQNVIQSLTNARPAIRVFTVSTEKLNEYSESWIISIPFSPNRACEPTSIDVSRFSDLCRVTIGQRLDDSLSLDLQFVILEKDKTPF